VAGGEVTANGQILNDGDAMALEQESLLQIETLKKAEVLVFDVK
jgi:redox-sensitive bicupin YhaK (pirin superfamily)